MNHSGLFQNIRTKRSFLCIGLDTEITKIPGFLLDLEDPVFEFNKAIIEATYPFVVAYKLNTAFYECDGIKGWKSLESTLEFIKRYYPDIMVIADAKRGDIGNTSRMYAKAFFENLSFDAVTVAPYMGEDSVAPFLSYEGKYVILLALTSNKGADDFQFHTENGIKLYEQVISVSKKWGSPDNMMYVVGATRSEVLSGIRNMVPDHFLLIPGIGAQGGSLENVVKHGMTDKCGLLVNSSRGIIFADNSEYFDKSAATKAEELQKEMEQFLISHNII
jgi:orotidine-5'-phosphate decarboxylase